MPTDIQRVDVQRLMEQDAQLVEVLHTKEYAREHLPRAIHIPLVNIKQPKLAPKNSNTAIDLAVAKG